ncbi:hypothetical protein HID58_022644, partial [Brassica napus]
MRLFKSADSPTNLCILAAAVKHMTEEEIKAAIHTNPESLSLRH